MDNNYILYLQWSRNNQENAIDQLYISVKHVKQNFSGRTLDNYLF